MPRDHTYQRERGARQEARILAACAGAPKTAKAIANAVNLHLSRITTYLRRLMNEPRRMYVAGHLDGINIRSAPLYAVGDLPDVPCIPKCNRRQPSRFAAQVARVSDLLASPMTTKEISIKIECCTKQAAVYIKDLRSDKKVHISDWRGRAPVYAIGNKKDKAQPRRTRKQEYQAEMKDLDKSERIFAQRRARTAMARATRKPSTWLTALGI